MKYNIGDKIGPYNIQIIKVEQVTSGGRTYYYLTGICQNCEGENTFRARADHVRSGAIHRCKECGIKARSGINNPRFKDLTNKRFGKLTVVKLIGSDQKIINNRTSEEKKNVWECQCECGNLIYRTTNELTSNVIGSCPNCYIKSRGEWEIAYSLKELNIRYEAQKTFKGCKDERLLPFDFYLPQYNVCIQYDGSTHSEPNKYGSWNTEEAVLLVQKHDKIKDQFCKQEGIKLIRISYKDLDKITPSYLQSLI